MTTPNETHLRAARELLVCLAAGATRFTEDDAKYGAEILLKHFPAAPASPATPSGTPSDAELRQMLLTCDGAGKKAKEDALNELLRVGAAAIHDAASRQHTDRITALSAQVAELERDKARLEKIEELYATIPDSRNRTWYDFMNQVSSIGFRAAIDSAMNHQGPK